MKSLFSGGYRGLSDSIFSGQRGSVSKSVGIDSRSKPGVLKAHQRLTKDSGTVVDELCKSAVTLKDGKKVWFGGRKAYLDNAGTYSEKLDFSAITKDILFTSRETDTFIGEPSSIVRFNATGSVAYVSSTSTGKIRQYSLSELYNLDTATLVYTFTVAHTSFWVSDSALFALDTNQVRVFALIGGNLLDATQNDVWDISAQTTTATDISFNTAGTQLFIMDADGDVYSYTLSPAFGQNMPAFRMLLAAGGGSGAGTGSTGNDDERIGGGGGAGGLWEGFEEYLEPSVSYDITVGAGANGVIGDNQGLDGADTVAFGKTLRGGGGGGKTDDNDRNQEVNDGRDGGSGGGGGEHDEDGGADTNGQGGQALGTGSFSQTGTRGGRPNGGGLSWVSEISGSSVTYAQGGGNAADNNSGADANTVGGGGEGAHGNDTSVSYNGGAGFRGEAILRFKTADVTYTQTGGTVTTDGADTIIVWTTTGTFSHTVTSPITYASTQSFPTARAFAVESGRVLFIVGDSVVQYTMTAYDFATATKSDNELATNSELANLVSPRGLFIAPDALYISYETGGKSNRLSVSKHTFVTSGTDILNAKVLTVSVPTLAKTKKLYDSVGATESRASNTGYNGTDPTVVVNTNRLLDIFIRNFIISASFVRVFFSPDPTQNIRGYATAKSASTITVTEDDDIATDNFIQFDTVVADAMILQESAGKTSFDGKDVVIQPITLTRNTTLDSVKVKLREGHGINGGYTVKLDIKNGATVVATSTVTIGPDDIGTSETLVDFTFTAATLVAGTKYTFEVSIPSVASLGFNRRQNRYVVCPVKTRTVADERIPATDDVEMQLQMFDSTITDTEADTINEERIYFVTDKMAFYIKASDVAGSWVGKVQAVGEFENGADVHPMAIQNLSLFIGDAFNMAEINRFGRFVPVTNLNVPKGETITALAPFDIDIVIGTQIGNYGRALRWDGISESWNAEDIVYEKGGITAFIIDDNFIYPVAGNRGSIYYYNGAKCEDFVTIPEIENQDTIKVNGNAVGYFRGTPLVGVSNLSGNPVLQGIYGYGSYNSNYAKSLSLDFPMPSGQFAGVEIGAILTEGNDLYVAWTDGTDTGIAKIDWSNKYASAYFETLTLTQAMNRHQAKTVSDVIVPYHKLPASTGITIGINKDYDTAYTNMDVLDGTVRKVVKLKSPSTPDTINPQLRIGLTVNANDTPEIEDVLFAIASVGNK